MEKPGWVYIMASGRNGTLYIGATSDLVKRVWEHRNGVVAGFTNEYRCTALVWFVDCGTIEVARQREKAMKKWRRAWKLREIEAANPDWNDLFPSLV